MARGNDISLDTLLAQADHFVDADTGAVVPPMQHSSTFARDESYGLRGEVSYGRYGNPTTELAESIVAKAEQAEEALLFSSGMSAFVALIETLPTGARVVAPRVMYHGASDWLRRMAAERGLVVDFFDVTGAGALEETVAAAPVALVWIESPVNPTWDVIDIRAAIACAHDAGAMIGVDSTVAPPVTTRPLALGADFVFHSATKYLNGHSDVSAGVLAVSKNSDRWERIKSLRGAMGSVLPSFQAWLLIRGMRTLAVRYERLSSNALRLAEHFEGHPKLEAVLYPGLKSHAGHEIAKSQMEGGFGGMLSILTANDEDGAKAQKVATGVRIFIPATSLGGVESLIEHRTVVEGPNSIVPKNLLRLSIGIEAAEDLIGDLEQALERA